MNTHVPRTKTAIVTSRARRWGIAAVLAAALVSSCGSDPLKSDSSNFVEERLNESASAPPDTSGSALASTVVPGGDESTVATDGGSSPAASGVDSSVPVEKVAIDKTVWWGGFKLTVGSAEWSSNALGATINITVAFENLTDDVNVLNRDKIVLTVGTQSYLGGLGQAPSVPAKGRNDAVLDFFVDETFTVDDAVLTFGQPDTNQAIVPLGAGDATSFEPKVLNVKSQLVTPTVTVSLLGGSIDASYAPAEKGTYILRLVLEATNTVRGSAGELILPTQFALESPSGSSFVAAPIAPGDIVAEALYTNQNLTGKDAAFKIDDLATGTWTVTFTDSAGQPATGEFVVE